VRRACSQFFHTCTHTNIHTCSPICVHKHALINTHTYFSLRIGTRGGKALAPKTCSPCLRAGPNPFVRVDKRDKIFPVSRHRWIFFFKNESISRHEKNSDFCLCSQSCEFLSLETTTNTPSNNTLMTTDITHVSSTRRFL